MCILLMIMLADKVPTLQVEMDNSAQHDGDGGDGEANNIDNRSDDEKQVR